MKIFLLRNRNINKHKNYFLRKLKIFYSKVNKKIFIFLIVEKYAKRNIAYYFSYGYRCN